MKNIVRIGLISISFLLLTYLVVDSFLHLRFVALEPNDYYINNKKSEISNIQNTDSLKSVANYNLDYTKILLENRDGEQEQKNARFELLLLLLVIQIVFWIFFRDKSP